MQTLDSTAEGWDVILTREKFEDCVFYYSCYSLNNDQQGDYQLGEGVHLCVIACVCVCVLISNCLSVNKPANGSSS